MSACQKRKKATTDAVAFGFRRMEDACDSRGTAYRRLHSWRCRKRMVSVTARTVQRGETLLGSDV